MFRLPRLRRALALTALPALLAAASCVHQDDPSLHGASAPARRAHPTTTSVPVSTTTTTVPPTTTTAAPFDPNALRPPAPAADPAGLAAQIVAAETTLRDPSADARSVDDAALAQQVAYRQLGYHPEWDAAVLAAVPPPLVGIVQRQAGARREFGAMHAPTAPGPPSTWQIMPPAPLSALEADYRGAGAMFGIPWQYLAAVNLVETATGRIHATSVAGAQGPMQFLPSTWAAYGGGGNIQDPHDAIFAAARYLAANGGATDLRNALWHYNHSDHYVLGVLLYGDLIAEHPLALRGFYNWGVWYRTTGGDLFLPPGYGVPGAAP